MFELPLSPGRPSFGSDDFGLGRLVALPDFNANLIPASDGAASPMNVGLRA